VEKLDAEGLYCYDQMIGNTWLEAVVHLTLEPAATCIDPSTPFMALLEPTVTLSPAALESLGVDLTMAQEDAIQVSNSAQTLVGACQRPIHHGPLCSYAMANLHCTVEGSISWNTAKNVKIIPSNQQIFNGN